MTVYVLPHHQQTRLSAFDVTTHGGQFRPLSPMLLGPVMLYGGHWSRNVENAWQFSKVYPGYEDEARYWPWACAGWADERAHRYPAGKGVRPHWSLWAGSKLGYIEARKRIYLPLYAQAVRFYQLGLLTVLRSYASQGDIALRDFDAYDHRALGYSWQDVMNDPDRKMGHGFVLAMMIEGVL
jgi:hypothetical protein